MKLNFLRILKNRILYWDRKIIQTWPSSKPWNKLGKIIGKKVGFDGLLGKTLQL